MYAGMCDSIYRIVNSSSFSMTLLARKAMASPGFNMEVMLGTQECDMMDTIGYNALPWGASPTELVCRIPNALLAILGVTKSNLQIALRNLAVSVKAEAKSTSSSLQSNSIIFCSFSVSLFLWSRNISSVH